MSRTPQRTPPRHHQRTLSALTTLAALSLAPVAVRAADAPLPNAGSILQQIQPPAPLPPSGSTGLAVEPGRAGAAVDSAPFEIKQLQISGNTRFDTTTLHALVSEAEGRRMTLRELDALIQRITTHYRQAGYPLARAIIPVQTIRDGVVRIEVIEARYGRVLLDNKSSVRDSLLQGMLAPLQPGDLVSQAELDRALLLLSDIPGMELGALLRAGEAVGSSDLLVNTAAGARFGAYVDADNYGNEYTGRAQARAGLSYFNALGLGDVASLDVLSSGDKLKYARLGYELQLGSLGTRAGAAWSSLEYRLGQSASDLDAHGNADVGSAWITHPWVRSVALNVNSQLEYEHFDLRDRVDASSIRNDRHLDKVTLSLSGNVLSSWAGGMADTWRLDVGRGQVNFDDSAAQLADAATARTEGNFTLWNLYLSHSQNLGASTVLAVMVNAQQTTTNLDPSQKFTLGGPYAVRAYDTGEIQGDTGYTLIAELRQSLNALGVGSGAGQWQAVAFADTGHVKVNRTPWASGANGATMSGVGLGLNWFGPAQWSARASVATPVGADPDISGVSRHTRGWVSLNKGF
jgi:hemolysin activation/secretion protein